MNPSDKIELGKWCSLEIMRDTRVGCYLSDGIDEILLPLKYVPDTCQPGDKLTVFCYLDNEQRPIATTLEPLISRNEFGWLQVAETNQFGAFMEWGLEKHLLVPFREQATPMVAGKYYPVFCYLDPKSGRLAGSSRLERFLSNEGILLKSRDEVEIFCYRQTDLGYEVVINSRHKGLVFKDQVHAAFGPGSRRKAYIKSVRKDGKIDVVLEPLGHQKLEPAAERIFQALEAAGGKLSLHDKSDPEAIKASLQMSKKLFKRGVGILYKAGKIELGTDGISIKSGS